MQNRNMVDGNVLVFHCCYNKLPQIWQPKQHTYLLSHGSHGSEVQGQLIMVLSSGLRMAVIKVSVRLHFYLGKNFCFQAYSGFRQNSFPRGYVMEGGPGSLQLSARDYTQVLEATHIFLPCELPQYGSLLHQVSKKNPC